MFPLAAPIFHFFHLIYTLEDIQHQYPDLHKEEVLLSLVLDLWVAAMTSKDDEEVFQEDTKRVDQEDTNGLDLVF